MITFLIVCPLVFLGGFVDAIAGGGGLISLPAYLLSGLPVHVAIGTNKLSSAMGTSVTTLEFARSGYIKLKLSIGAMIAAIIGSSTGAQLALHLSDYYFRIILLFILPITGLYLLFRKGALEVASADSEPTRRQMGLAILLTLILGIYDGFYGPGAGTFFLLVLTGVAHFPINLAAGTTKMINLTTNLTGLTVFMLSGKVFMLLGLVAGLFGILGNHIGVIYFQKHGSKVARPLILIVLTIFFLKVIYDFVK